jgi:Uma2 family endonuclease
MVDGGILREDEPLELIDGELVVVSPQGPAHAARVAYLTHRLQDVYRQRAHVRAQLPVDLRPHNLPEPDLAIVAGDPRAYRQRHPGQLDVWLAVEVARTSQALDRRKIAIYGAAGIPVYWLIDLENGRIEVFSDPVGGGYASQEVLRTGDSLELPRSTERWPVSDLLS